LANKKVKSTELAKQFFQCILEDDPMLWEARACALDLSRRMGDSRAVTFLNQIRKAPEFTSHKNCDRIPAVMDEAVYSLVHDGPEGSDEFFIAATRKLLVR